MALCFQNPGSVVVVLANAEHDVDMTAGNLVHAPLALDEVGSSSTVGHGGEGFGGSYVSLGAAGVRRRCRGPEQSLFRHQPGGRSCW